MVLVYISTIIRSDRLNRIAWRGVLRSQMQPGERLVVTRNADGEEHYHVEKEP